MRRKRSYRYFIQKVLFASLSILAYQLFLLIARFDYLNLIFMLVNVGIIALVYLLVSD